MTDPEIVTKKLAILAEHIGRAEARRARTLEEMQSSTEFQDAFAMSLFVAIQETIDIAFHICADERWGVPSSNPEGFNLLAEHELFDKALAVQLAAVARLRNRIAHGYASVDFERLWQEAPDGISSLREYSAAVAKWLERQPDSA